MRTKRIELCTPGSVLWENVCYSNKEILFKKGTVLTENDISLIEEIGIKYVVICSTPQEVHSVSKFDLSFTSKVLHETALASTLVADADKSIDYSKFKNICVELQRHQYNVAMLTAMVISSSIQSIGTVKQSIIGALLHDIGKTEIPDSILYSNRKLTNDEKRLISNHPNIGYDILKKLGYSDIVCNIAREHHENMNGTGYPNFMEEDEISYPSKIVHVADVYEAMCAERCYRGPMERSRVRSIMCYECAKYGKDILDTFMKEVPIYMVNDVIAYKDRLYKVIGYTQNKCPLVLDVYTNEEYDLLEFNPAYIEAGALKLG